jgi:hypothetical protein
MRFERENICRIVFQGQCGLERATYGSIQRRGWQWDGWISHRAIERTIGILYLIHVCHEQKIQSFVLCLFPLLSLLVWIDCT